MTNNYDIQFKNSFDHNLILQHDFIKDTYKKCSKYTNSIFNTYDKTEYDIVYAIGDVHGDYESLIIILEYIKCIEYRKENNKNKIHWNSNCKNICLIQTGDIMDGYRHDNPNKDFISKDLKAIKLLLRLSEECLQYNSRVILIYGNHEISAFYRMIDKVKLDNYAKAMLNPTNEKIQAYNKKLRNLEEQITCNYHTICIVNGYIFCHSGFILKIIMNILNSFKINEEDFVNLKVSDKLFLINICSLGIFQYILSGKVNKNFINQLRFNFMKVFNNREYESIVHEIKHLSSFKKIKLLNNMNETNLILNAKGMIIGHNTITKCKINHYNNLWGIDAKISEGFGEDKINAIFQILKIEKDKDPEVISIPNKNFKRLTLSNV